MDFRAISVKSSFSDPSFLIDFNVTRLEFRVWPTTLKTKEKAAEKGGGFVMFLVKQDDEKDAENFMRWRSKKFAFSHKGTLYSLRAGPPIGNVGLDANLGPPFRLYVLTRHLPAIHGIHGHSTFSPCLKMSIFPRQEGPYKFCHKCRFSGARKETYISFERVFEDIFLNSSFWFPGFPKFSSLFWSHWLLTFSGWEAHPPRPTLAERKRMPNASAEFK